MSIAVPSVGVGTIGTSASSIVVTKPTGLAVGDFMIAHCYATIDSATAPVWNTPSGWTFVKEVAVNYPAVPRKQLHSTFSKKADSSDVAASNFTFTTAATADKIGASVYRITGQEVSGEVEVSASGVNTNGSTSIPVFSTISVTPSLVGSLILLFGGGPTTPYSAYQMANNDPIWTEDYDVSDTNFGAFGAHAIRSAVTATGDIQYTAGGSAQTVFGAIIIVVRPYIALTASVTDSITISESITMVEWALISVSDSISISESVSDFIYWSINVSETITINESVTVVNSQLGNISVSDPITITEYHRTLVVPHTFGVYDMRSNENNKPLPMDDRTIL